MADLTGFRKPVRSQVYGNYPLTVKGAAMQTWPRLLRSDKGIGGYKYTGLLDFAGFSVARYSAKRDT